MAPGLVDQLGDAVLGVAVALNELAIAFRLLNRVQVLALDILDQGELSRRRFYDFTDKRGDHKQTLPLRRPPTPFAGDDLIALAVAVRPQQDRLQDTAL